MPSARTPQPQDPLIGRTVLGCRLEQRLGAGALAVVYAGTRAADGSRVAVKMLTTVAAKDPENVKRHRREAELGAMVKHPNIAAVHAAGIEGGGIHVLVMELVEGASMEAIIDKRGRLPWREAAHLIGQVAGALAHLGTVGVVHRDIKPGNILLTAGGVAKLVDLGFAKSDEAHGAEGLTLAGTAMGSPAYMPPEQVTDAKAAGHAADVYALGATFFHAVTGRTPFTGRTTHEIMSKVVREPAPSARAVQPEVPPAIDALIAWCMAKQPGHRPADAAAFTRELERAVAAPEDAARIAALRRRREGVWIVLAVVVAAALALYGLWRLLH